MDLEAFVRRLLADGYLEEVVVHIKNHFIKSGSVAVCYLSLGKNSQMLMNDNVKVTIDSEIADSRRKSIADNTVSPLERLEEECYDRIVEVVQVLADQAKVSWKNLVSTNMIREMSSSVIRTADEMSFIDGMTAAKLTLVSERLLPILTEFADKRERLLDEQNQARSAKKATGSVKKARKVEIVQKKQRFRPLLSSDDEEHGERDNDGNGSIICIGDEEAVVVGGAFDGGSSPYFGGRKSRKRDSSLGDVG